MELALLLIIAACVIALIYINKKSKALEDEANKERKALEEAIKESEALDEKPTDIPQNTISCPFCSGENNAGTKVCNICGRDISNMDNVLNNLAGE